MLKIYTYPNKILTGPAEKVSVIDSGIRQLVDQMKETLEKNERKGIGLAAPQVGRKLRVIIAKEDREKSDPVALINPEITSSSSDMEEGYEGCLSIPNSYCLVRRYKKIIVKALNPKGNKVTIKASNLFARVLQHEIDHLDGILITSKAIGKVLTEQEYNKVMQLRT